jgi:hypothetical protein
MGRDHDMHTIRITLKSMASLAVLGLHCHACAFESGRVVIAVVMIKGAFFDRQPMSFVLAFFALGA